jgi:hypothetical protein
MRNNYDDDDDDDDHESRNEIVICKVKLLSKPQGHQTIAANVLDTISLQNLNQAT